MGWIFLSLQWYLMLFILGLIFLPFTKKIFGSLFIDLGYGFAKTIGILLLSYSVFVLGLLKIVSFTQTNLLFLLFLFVLLNIFKFKKNNPSTSLRTSQQSIILIIFEEILFLASLLFWVYVRGQEPSIRGLEKFMDFGFMNSILRSKYFPPLDIWYSGYPINYYYFGHLAGAVLIKLGGFKSAFGYNLILATIFALSVTQTFSLIVNILFRYAGRIKLIFFGLLGAFIVNLGGNLHTIYLFSKGYPNENPIPFWKILFWYNPTKYWYPNATRFIPYTIHEFPSYSWVVADLHGHVFDIPFVLLTLAILFMLIIKFSVIATPSIRGKQFHLRLPRPAFGGTRNDNNWILKQLNNLTIEQLLFSVSLGFLTAVHYMTNAFDGPIYILLSLIIFLYIYRITKKFVINSIILIGSFILFSLPFTINFKPFVSGIGVNCSPEFLVKIGKVGPFLFEKGNCQISPFWMMFLLWGFFWINFLIFLFIKYRHKESINNQQSSINNFLLILFSFGTFLIIIPEFFYIKDIYPAHFRANTMFKLGYQAFIMMGIASTITFSLIKKTSRLTSIFLSFIFIFILFFISIYPSFSISSYYGKLDRPVEIDGAKWMEASFPEDKEIIDYINENIPDQPIILEAQGDSYTDFERISAYTGLPTVAGWWVHEWLWRGSADFVGKRIPDVVAMYESANIDESLNLFKKYKVKYVVISKMEKQKYPNLKEDKFSKIGTLVFTSSNKNGALYKLNY